MRELWDQAFTQSPVRDRPYFWPRPQICERREPFQASSQWDRRGQGAKLDDHSDLGLLESDPPPNPWTEETVIWSGPSLGKILGVALLFVFVLPRLTLSIAKADSQIPSTYFGIANSTFKSWTLKRTPKQSHERGSGPFVGNPPLCEWLPLLFCNAVIVKLMVWGPLAKWTGVKGQGFNLKISGTTKTVGAL